MVALDIDVIMIQEVWAPGQVKQLLASMYQVMISDTMDQGTGFMIAWRRDLLAEKTERKVVYDAQDFYAVKTHWTGIGLSYRHQCISHPAGITSSRKSP